MIRSARRRSACFQAVHSCLRCFEQNLFFFCGKKRKEALLRFFFSHRSVEGIYDESAFFRGDKHISFGGGRGQGSARQQRWRSVVFTYGIISLKTVDDQRHMQQISLLMTGE